MRLNNNDIHLKQGACFVAGTLVHTARGLVPIQEVKVGDKVLSRDEHNPNGELAYKKVLSTFKSPRKEKLYKVEYHNVTGYKPGDKCRQYIFCTGSHPFWRSLKPNSKKGEWTPAEDLFGGYLNSIHGDELELGDYSVIPVRTLPNFPQGCAYVQHVEDHKDWNEDAENVEFVRFYDKGYQFVCLADNEERFEEELRTLNLDTINSCSHLSSTSPFVVDEELYKTLNTRVLQDIYPSTHCPEQYVEYMNQPLIVEGELIQESRIACQKGYERTLKNITQYGNSTGLTSTSLHNGVEDFYAQDSYPNPYSDHVYNLEVEDYHTYYVGHDGVWVHNCDPNTVA